MGLGGLFSVLGIFVLFSSFKSQQSTVQKMGQVVGFSYGPGGKIQKPVTFRTVLRFQGIDANEYYLVSSVGTSRPLHVMGEFMPILLSRTEKKRVYFKNPAEQKWGRILLLLGLICFGYTSVRYHFNLKFFGIAMGFGTIISAVLHSESKKKNGFDWRKWVSGGGDLGSLVPPEVFPLEDAKFVNWAQVSNEDAVKAYDLRPVKTSSSNWGRTLSLIGALCCFGSGAKIYLETENFVSTAQRTTGIVVKLENKAGANSKGSTFAPVVDFYGPQKRVYRFTHTTSSNPPAYKLGQHVKVLYDLKNPNKAILDVGIWNYFMSLGMLAAGFVFLILSSRARARQLKAQQEVKTPPINIRRVG